MLTSNFANNSNFPLLVIEELASTNSFLKEVPHPLAPWSTVCARVQTKGRGRFDRRWEAVPYADLTFSTLIPSDQLPLQNLPSITPIVGFSILKVCHRLGVITALKWPNDILVGEKKMAGILVEVITQGDLTIIVAGVGLNVNSCRAELPGATTISLRDVVGKELSLDEVLVQCVAELQSSFAKFAKEGFRAFVTDINRILAWKGEWRTVIDGSTSYDGYIEGVGSSGELLFRHAQSGAVVALTSGELSFRMATL